MLKTAGFSTRILLLLMLLMVLIFSLSRGSHSPFHQAFDSINKTDFSAYWSAFHLLINRQNPYDLEALNQYQQASGVVLSPPLWNGPWTFILLAPFLIFNFKVSFFLWMATNIGFVFINAFMAWKITSEQPVKPLLCLLVGTFFIPVMQNLKWAQMGLLMTLATAGIFWALQKKRDYWAGFLLIFWSIKPHLFHLIIPLLGLWILETKRWKILLSLFLTAAVLMALLLWAEPEVLSQWFYRKAYPSAWKSSTLATLLREFLYQKTGQLPIWPLFVIPGITILFFLTRLKPLKKINWQDHLPPLLCWSLFSAPYGWIHDQSLLVIANMGIVSRLSDSRLEWRARLEIIILFLTLHTAAFVWSFFFLKYQHSFFWFPLALASLWYRTQYRLGIKQNQI